MATTVEIIWDTHENLIIRDVHEKCHDRVQNFMLENYFKPHKLFNKLDYQDDPDVNKEYLKYVSHILKDECSIVVLDADTDKIFGVALLKCMTKEWRSWTAFEICIDQCKLSEVVELQYRMMNQYTNLYPETNFDSLHLFEYCLPYELRNDDIFMNKFFTAISENARHMQMERVTFLALSSLEQEECYEQGYEHLSYAIYSVFTLHNKRPFATLRDIEEMEAGLFQMEVEPIVPYYEMSIRNIEEPPPLEKKVSMSAPKRAHSVMSVD